MRARKVRRSGFPYVSHVMWPIPINCPWPWLVDELVVRFTMMVREVICGIEAEVVQSVKQTSPLSGHMQQTSSFSSNVLRGTFQQYPGEPEQKFQDRLDHEFSTVRQ